MNIFYKQESLPAFVLFVLAFSLLSCKKTNYSETNGVKTLNIPPTNLLAPPPPLQLNPFYKKYVDAGGIPIVSSEYT